MIIFAIIGKLAVCVFGLAIIFIGVDSIFSTSNWKYNAKN